MITSTDNLMYDATSLNEHGTVEIVKPYLSASCLPLSYASTSDSTYRAKQGSRGNTCMRTGRRSYPYDLTARETLEDV
jgi:hypothetical protein